MATVQLEYILQVTDVNGDTALCRLVSDQSDTNTLATIGTDIAAFATKVAACTNGKITSQALHVGFVKAQISASTAPPPASAIYPSVTDGSLLNFSASGGAKRRVVVPAPLLTNFITGSNTVNASDGNIAPLIAFIEAEPGVGGTPNLYQGGVKTGKHSRRRPARKTL